MQGIDNWAVFPDHWERMQRNMTTREWQRRGLALDVGPERMLYHTWDRARNLRPVPDLGAVDVTQQVLSHLGKNMGCLIGHDPGSIYDVSIILKAYLLPKAKRHTWWVVDEVTTKGTTTEQHALELRTRLQEHHDMCVPIRRKPDQFDHIRPFALIHCDPYGENDSKPDRSVYLQFRKLGFAIKSAAYKNGKVARVIPREARIEMVCRLLCNAAGETYLNVACDRQNQPVAPRLVASLEMSERDEMGRPETQKKDERDQSHWPVSLGYALYKLERLRSSDANWREAAH